MKFSTIKCQSRANYCLALASTVLLLSACGGGGGGSLGIGIGFGGTGTAALAGDSATSSNAASTTPSEGSGKLTPTDNLPPSAIPPSLGRQSVSCLPATAPGSTYNVGAAAGQLSKLSDVPWATLAPGDVVRVHWRSTPYREQLLISASGTEGYPIRICGVNGGPNANDNFLPIISGENAVVDPKQLYGAAKFHASATSLAGPSVLEQLGMVTINHHDYSKKPKNIIIEGFHITGANQYTKFTDSKGITNHPYSPFVACIRVQKGDNIVIRGNEISNCGNGVFALSRDGESSSSRNILIEGNYIHSNGAAADAGDANGRIHSLDLASIQLDGTPIWTDSYIASESIHAMYIQTIGMTAQFNYFGANRPRAKGGLFKDRSIGSVIRYNWFDQAARVIDLVEPQDYDTMFKPAAWKAYNDAYPNDTNQSTEANMLAAAAKYEKTYVYGNFIRNAFATDASGAKTSEAAFAPVHFGGDQNDWELGRSGKLYFFSNTMVTIADQADSYSLNVFDLQSVSKFTQNNHVVAFNNIIQQQSRTPGGTKPEYYLARHHYGNIDLGNNWVSNTKWLNATGMADPLGNELQRLNDQYHNDEAGTHAADVKEGLITGLLKLFTSSTPGASAVNSSTLLSAPGNANLINKGQAMPAELNGLVLDYQLQVNFANPRLSLALPRLRPKDMGAADIAP